MRKLIFLILLLPSILVAQTKVYKGSSSLNSDVLFTIKEGKIYKGTSTTTSNILFTVKDNKVYKGHTEILSCVVMNYDDHYFYRSHYHNRSDILYSYDNLHNIYYGYNQIYNNLAFNFGGSNLFNKKSSLKKDLALHVSGYITIGELVTIINYLFGK